MYYFAYGSNMSLGRMLRRVPTAKHIAVASLESHSLRFHKLGKDGSGKCDAFHSDDPNDYIIGVLYEIPYEDKVQLDVVEGLGEGYDEKKVTIWTSNTESLEAVTYFATKIDDTLKPFDWYKEHVLKGAVENELPFAYQSLIDAVQSMSDPDSARHKIELEIYSI